MDRKLIYKVIIGWRCEFEFNESMQAMIFLETAAIHKTESNDESIRLEVIEPEEPAETEEAEDYAV